MRSKVKVFWLCDQTTRELTEGVDALRRCPLTEENFLPFVGTSPPLVVAATAAASDASLATFYFSDAAT